MNRAERSRSRTSASHVLQEQGRPAFVALRRGGPGLDRTERFPQETFNSRFRDSVVLKNDEIMMKNRQKDCGEKNRSEMETGGTVEAEAERRPRNRPRTTWHLSYVSARQGSPKTSDFRLRRAYGATGRRGRGSQKAAALAKQTKLNKVKQG
jgi:hypothetical protein